MALPYDQVEAHVLSVFVRATRCRDRRAQAGAVDHNTGLPVSSANLLSRELAISGDRLAMELVVIPRSLAASILRRSVDKSVHENGHVALQALPPSTWTDEERELVDALEHRIKVVAHRLEKNGWINTRPDGMYEGEKLPYGTALNNDGMTCAFQITWEGLKEAKKRYKGTAWDQGPLSPEADLTREAWSKRPDWARSES